MQKKKKNPNHFNPLSNGINPTSISPGLPGAGKSWVSPWNFLPSAVEPLIPDLEVGDSTRLCLPPRKCRAAKTGEEFSPWENLGHPGPGSSWSHHPLQQKPGINVGTTTKMGSAHSWVGLGTEICSKTSNIHFQDEVLHHWRNSRVFSKLVKPSCRTRENGLKLCQGDV